MAPRSDKTTLKLFISPLMILLFIVGCVGDKKSAHNQNSTEKVRQTFEQFVAEIPLVPVRVELHSYNPIKHIEIKSPHIPEGAALFGKLKSMDGYHFIIYTYPADIRLPILEVYDNDGIKLMEKQLYRYNGCPATNSGGSTIIIKNQEMIVMQTFCDVYDGRYDSDTLMVSRLIEHIN